MGSGLASLRTRHRQGVVGEPVGAFIVLPSSHPSLPLQIPEPAESVSITILRLRQPLSHGHGLDGGAAYAFLHEKSTTLKGSVFIIGVCIFKGFPFNLLIRRPLRLGLG
jgi:hypothetical protein